MDVKFSLVLPREALSLGVMRRVLGDTLGALGVTSDCVSDILVAATEACTNVLLHGGSSRAYEVMARVGGSRCLLEVVETGPRLDPRRNLWTADSWRPGGHLRGLPRRPRHKTRTSGWLTWHGGRPGGAAASTAAAVPAPASSKDAGPAGSVSGRPGSRPDDGGPGGGSSRGAPSIAHLPESGRGLQIMQALVDDVTLRSAPGRGTSVSMQKHLTWRSDAPLAALPPSRLREAG